MTPWRSRGTLVKLLEARSRRYAVVASPTSEWQTVEIEATEPAYGEAIWSLVLHFPPIFLFLRVVTAMGASNLPPFVIL